jgi:signal transduction histidine kinase
MQTRFAEIDITPYIASSLLLLIVGGFVIYYFFLVQRKKFQHQEEVFTMREEFNQTLLESKLEIQEQTLDHIAKELHANFSHLVSLININLSEILPQGTTEMRESIIETKSLAKQLLSELKALSASLNTDHIIHIGFSKALNNELTRLGKAKKYQVSFTKTGQEYRLRPDHEIILFRLCQEILNNTLKYAKAKSVTALLAYSVNQFTLELSDDGIGFNVDEAINQSGEKESTGLINIKKRARLINAEVNIESKPDKGTKFIITIPN